MKTLCIAIGNPLRGDDNVAHRVAASFEGSCILVRHVIQLTPEMAAEIAECERVVFLDADVRVTRVRLDAVDESRTSTGVLAHRCDPAYLVALARRLYGWRGEAVLCRIPAQDFTMRDVVEPVPSTVFEM